jgi:hypothetical protein
MPIIMRSKSAELRNLEDKSSCKAFLNWAEISSVRVTYECCSSRGFVLNLFCHVSCFVKL